MTVLTGNDVTFEYDEVEDILYVVIGDSAGRAAITCETDDGHLVRLDAETHKLIGAEVLGFRRNWEGRDITLEWEPPQSWVTRLRRETPERVVLPRQRVLA